MCIDTSSQHTQSRVLLYLFLKLAVRGSQGISIVHFSVGGEVKGHTGDTLRYMYSSVSYYTSI